LELLPLLLPRGPAPLLQPRIGAAGAGGGVADEGRFPIEDDIADDDLIPGEGAGVEQPLLHPEGREPVGEVAHRFIVLEVRLFDPPLGFVALHVEVFLPTPLLARDGEFVLANPAHGRGAQHDPLRLGRRCVRSRSPSRLAVETSNTGQPRSSISGRTNSASSFASGTSTLLSTTSRGRWASGTCPPSMSRSLE